MSKGPGAVEQRIADLFAATRDRVLSVAEIADYAFELGGCECPESVLAAVGSDGTLAYLTLSRGDTKLIKAMTGRQAIGLAYSLLREGYTLLQREGQPCLTGVDRAIANSPAHACPDLDEDYSLDDAAAGSR